MRPVYRVGRIEFSSLTSASYHAKRVGAKYVEYSFGGEFKKLTNVSF